MTDFINSLLAKNTSQPAAVRPRPRALFEPLPPTELLAWSPLPGDKSPLPSVAQPASGTLMPADPDQGTSHPTPAAQARFAAPDDGKQPAPVEPHLDYLPPPLPQAKFAVTDIAGAINPARAEPDYEVSAPQSTVAVPASSPVVPAPAHQTASPTSHPETSDIGATAVIQLESLILSSPQTSTPDRSGPRPISEEHVPAKSMPSPEPVPATSALRSVSERNPFQVELASSTAQMAFFASEAAYNSTVSVQPGQPPLPAASKTASERPATGEPPATLPATVEPQPVIQVTIGRIEVRATAPSGSSAARSHPAKPAISLDDYLRRRSGDRQ